MAIKSSFSVATFGGKAVYQGTIADRDHMQGEANYVVSKGIWTAKRGVLKPAAASNSAASSVEAERRAKELGRLLDSGDVAEFKKYATENFAPSFLNIPMERHLDFFRTMYATTRGVEFQSMQEASPTQWPPCSKAS